jgi:hypothetical protein
MKRLSKLESEGKIEKLALAGAAHWRPAPKKVKRS